MKSALMNMNQSILRMIGSFFYVGYIKIAPGTCASLATMLLVYYLTPYRTAPIHIQGLIILGVFLLGIPAARALEKHLDKKDPRQCVIDEVAGQMVSLLWVPHSMTLYLASFFIFRGFDIFKPYPVNHMEKMRGGLGIMIDDIGAGLYTLGLLHLGIYLFKLT